MILFICLVLKSRLLSLDTGTETTGQQKKNTQVVETRVTPPLLKGYNLLPSHWFYNYFFHNKIYSDDTNIEKETSNVIVTQCEMLADHCNAQEEEMTGKGAER